jgi:hypothetical protein
LAHLRVPTEDACPRSRERAGVRARACGQRGSPAAEILGGAGEGRGRALAGGAAGPQTARGPGQQGQGRWAFGILENLGGSGFDPSKMVAEPEAQRQFMSSPARSFPQSQR